MYDTYDTYPLAAQKIICDRSVSANELMVEMKGRKKQLTEDKKKRPEKIAVSAQACNFGKISEQILPAFLTFPYKQSECRILLQPIDYIVFTGLSGKGRVEVIKFVDVKTGNGRLSPKQGQIRECVIDGKITHKVIG
jgi:predicted Holliday junction resolvase-like endonuclease